MQPEYSFGASSEGILVQDFIISVASAPLSELGNVMEREELWPPTLFFRMFKHRSKRRIRGSLLTIVKKDLWKGEISVVFLPRVRSSWAIFTKEKGEKSCNLWRSGRGFFVVKFMRTWSPVQLPRKEREKAQPVGKSKHTGEFAHFEFMINEEGT